MKGTEGDSYQVALSHEDEIWLAHATDLKGVRSYGRTVRKAAANIPHPSAGLTIDGPFPADLELGEERVEH